MLGLSPPRTLTVGLLALSGCSVLLDFGGDITDAGPAGGDGAAAADGAATRCGAYEPNDVQAEAIELPAGVIQAAVCPKGDRDYYAFSVDGSEDVVVEVTFDNRGGLGDLDALLLDETGTELSPKGNGFGDVERIERTATSTHGRLAAGRYAVEVFAFDNDRENTYQLALSIDGPPSGDGGPIDGGPADGGP